MKPYNPDAQTIEDACGLTKGSTLWLLNEVRQFLESKHDDSTISTAEIVKFVEDLTRSNDDAMRLVTTMAVTYMLQKAVKSRINNEQTVKL